MTASAANKVLISHVYFSLERGAGQVSRVETDSEFWTLVKLMFHAICDRWALRKCWRCRCQMATEEAIVSSDARDRVRRAKGFKEGNGGGVGSGSPKNWRLNWGVRTAAVHIFRDGPSTEDCNSYMGDSEN